MWSVMRDASPEDGGSVTIQCTGGQTDKTDRQTDTHTQTHTDTHTHTHTYKTHTNPKQSTRVVSGDKARVALHAIAAQRQHLWYL